MPRKRKKKRTEKDDEFGEKEKKRTPRCFVLKRGKVGDRIRDLVKDFRTVMLPNCAQSLRESKLNRVEDFIQVAGQFHVTHIVVFTATKMGTYMKLVKLPQGPTLTFKVQAFTLTRDIKASQKRPRMGERDYTSAPLQVLSGFSGAGSDASKGMEKQLTAEMVRGMFPPIDVPTFNHLECRRVALFHFDRDKDVTYFRHFSVGRKESGLQRGVSKLLRRSRLPKLGHSEDVADFILSGGVGASESEADEPMEAPIEGGGKVGVRLTEVGPRLELQLIKAEDGVCTGNTLYHRYQKRTLTQIEVNEAKARQRRKLKERNAKLTAASESLKTKKRKEREERKKNAKRVEEEDGKKRNNKFSVDGDNGGDSDSGDGAAGGVDSRGTKKKRFHPFGWNKQDKKKRKDGKSHDVGGAQGRNAQTQQRVLDRFKKSQKR